MKQLFTLLMCLTLGSITAFAQNNTQISSQYGSPNTPVDNIGHWEEMAKRGVVERNPAIPVKPAIEGSSMVLTPKGLQNSPDVLLLDIAGNTQSENSVFVDPNDRDYILNSNNSNDGATMYGANYITSSDGGLNWSGTKLGAGGTDKGDPAACIGLNGRHYIGAINSVWKQVVSWSDDGTTWNKVNVVSGSYTYPDMFDKNHLWIDNTNSTQEGNVYNAWVNLVSGNANDTEIEFSRSTNDGISWSTPINISSAISAGSHNQGVNIQCNNTGWVFAVWAVYDDWGTGAYPEDAIGFARSGNGGASFYSATRIVSNIKGIRESASTANSTGKNMRVNSFPSMTIDVSGGTYHGDIYVIWANQGVPGINTGTNVSVYMTKSTNGGTIWSTPSRINTVAASNHAAYLPWISCDPVTGNLYTIFYDDRNFTDGSSDVETWVAFSEDGGASWADMAVSDVSFTPSPIPGLATGYFGDYLGISAYDGKVYPTWTDNRSGRALTYVSPLDFGCSATASNTSYEYISDVTFGSISNATGSDGYTDYTYLSNNLPLNAIQTITVTNGESYTGDQCGIWIDWNQDDDFDDANETMTVTGTPGVGPYTASVSPPPGTTLGQRKMRIRITYTGALEPCGTSSYGEVEDYTVNVTAASTNNNWLGATSTDWFTVSNWSLGTIPTSSVDVTISSGTPNQPTISGSVHANCRNLSILSGATLTQIGTSYFHVYGNFNSDLGTFTQTIGLAYLYFDGTINSYWDDDNEDDTYRYVRVDKDVNTSKVTMWQNMTVGGNLEVREGSLEFDANWKLTITGTGSNAFEVEDGGTFKLYNSQELDVAGGIEFESGSQANVTSGMIYCGGTFASLTNAAYDIQFTGGTVSMMGGTTQSINNQDGGLEFYNLTIGKTGGVCSVTSNDLVITNDLIIGGGTLNPNSLDIYVGGDWFNYAGETGFDQSTGRVIFNGGNYHQYCLDETFNELEINKASGGAFRMNGSDVVCAAYDWTAGAVDVLSGSFTANDLLDNAVQGHFYLNTGGTIDLTNSGTGLYVDLKGDLHIFGGTMTVSGSISEWPYLEDASIEMSGGVLDFTSCGITLTNNSYTLSNNITGGIIKTAVGFIGNRGDFTPTAGTFEFYGTSNASIYQSNGCTLYDVTIDKVAKGASAGLSQPTSVNGRVDKTIGDGKASNVFAGSDFVITNDLDITAGSFTLNGHEVTASHNCNVHGTLTMTSAADVLNVGSANYDILWFYNGSTGTISAGDINLYWGMIVDNGSSFTASTANTIHYNSAAWRGGIANDDPNTVFGNIDINKPSGYFQIWTDGSQPIVIDGDFSLAASNLFEMQDLSMIVHGNFSDQALSQTYLYNAFSKASKQGNNGSGSTANVGESTKGSGAKGGSLQIDNAFTLNGLMDVGDGDVLHHGYFNIGSTGNLTISTGSYVCDYDLAGGWSVLNGFVNMTGGLLEITNASTSFTGASNITGGVIRLGKSFQAASVSAGFQPTGGSVEFIGSTTSNYIRVSNGNTLNNFLFNRTGSYMIYPASTDDLIIKGDFEINSGVFNTNGNDILVGGNWANNAGSSAFTEGSSSVIFDGAYTADILTDETFYDVVVDKSAIGYEGLELMTGLSLNILNDLETIDGTLELNTNSTLTIGNDVLLGFESGLNAFGDLGLSIYVGGNWINDNTLWNTNYGYSPGTEVIYFNGSTDQTITTNAPKEDFGNLVIDKSSGQFRPNNNIDVMGDLLISDGQWSDNTPGLTHYFESDFEVGAAGAYFTHVSANTAVFKTTSDQNITYSSSSGYFHDVVIDKTDWPVKKSVGGGEIIENGSGNQSKDPMAMTVTLTTNLDMEFGSGLTIDEGTLNLNGHSFSTMGDININDGGTLIVNDNAILKVDGGDQLNVNTGGVLQAIGTAGNNAKISHRGSGDYYDFTVNSGGTIAAEYAILEYIDWYGVYVTASGIVDPAHAFNYCTFQNVNATISASNITLDNAQVLTCTGAHFPDNPYYNIYKNNAVGQITFDAATGDYAGAEYEWDANGLVDWGNVDIDMALTLMLEGPFNGSGMDTDLKDLGLVPTSQPFSSNPGADWYYTGGESVASVPANVVDWVLVQIRDASEAGTAGPGTVVAEQAAFLLSNGSIVDLDGTSNLDFAGISYSSGLFPVVWHRNHLGVIASGKMTRTGGVYTYDFSQSGSAFANTTDGEKHLGGGIYGMFAGDASAGGLISVWDVGLWETEAGTNGYLQVDFNMDSQADNEDKNDACIDNWGMESQITGSKKSDN